MGDSKRRENKKEEIAEAQRGNKRYCQREQRRLPVFLLLEQDEHSDSRIDQKPGKKCAKRQNALKEKLAEQNGGNAIRN